VKLHTMSAMAGKRIRRLESFPWWLNISLRLLLVKKTLPRI